MSVLICVYLRKSAAHHLFLHRDDPGFSDDDLIQVVNDMG